MSEKIAGREDGRLRAVIRGEAEGVVHGLEERILEREVLLVVASSNAGSVPERLPGSVF